MAKYRCLSDEILYNDNFLSLPPSARDLYNYINQNKHDDGIQQRRRCARETRCRSEWSE